MSFKFTAAHYAGLSRILITPLTLIYTTNYIYKKEILLVLVIIAIISDILDGYFSRRFNTVSNFGAFLDFTADKIFVSTTLIVLSSAGEIPLWIPLIVINREIWVMGIRIFSESEGFTISAGIFGKLKTIVLFGAIVTLLLNLKISTLLFSVGVILTVISLMIYTYRVINYLNKSTKYF